MGQQSEVFVAFHSEQPGFLVELDAVGLFVESCPCIVAAAANLKVAAESLDVGSLGVDRIGSADIIFFRGYGLGVFRCDRHDRQSPRRFNGISGCRGEETDRRGANLV